MRTTTAIIYCAQMWAVCNKGITQFYLPPTHEPAFTPQPQSITANWLLLIVPTHEGMARLS